MLCESLESRRLMSVSLSAAGVLTVQGTDNPDTIITSLANGKVVVNQNGVLKNFTATLVKKIAVYAKAGADHVEIATAITLPTYIDTGTGDPGGATGDLVLGGNGPDTIDVNAYFSSASGRGGNDIINNRGGFNHLTGDGGNDYLGPKFPGGSAISESNYDGGSGNDTLDYSSAINGLVIQNGLSSYYYADTGIPPLVDSSASDSTALFENFFGGKGDDFIYGTSGANLLKGNGGNDYIRGRGSNDTIYGGSGKDALYGDDGDDYLYASDGEKDFLSGGLGFDKSRKDAIDVINSVEGTI